MPTQLYLSFDEHLDWLTLIEFGSVENAQPEDHWRDVNDRFAYILQHPGGPEIGFKMRGFSSFDPEDPDVSEIWEGPRFDVPALGLKDSTAGEIVLAARPFLGGRSTINRVYFNRAMRAEGEEAEELWRYCLQSGDLMAHYALGHALRPRALPRGVPSPEGLHGAGPRRRVGLVLARQGLRGDGRG